MRSKKVGLISGLHVIAVGIAVSFNASAADSYLSGRISNVTFAGDTVLIMLDTGVPTNCTGTSYGWMMIPPAYKSMASFVIGLWMRGDIASVQLTIYTDQRTSGYCQINQIDPPN